MTKLSFFHRTIFFTGAVLSALFLFTAIYVSAAEEPPASREELPTGYAEKAPDTTGTPLQGSDNWFFHVDADLFYTYSDASDSDSLHGGGASLMLAPTYKFAEGAFLTLVYDGSYTKKRELYAADTEYKEREENQHHTITPILRIDFGEDDRFSIKPYVFATWDKNKDTDDAGWDDGLYNYEDIGGGADFKMRGLASGDAEGTMTLGFQLYQRDYVNYTSLLDLAAGLNLETDEKDYLGLILKSSYEYTQELGFNYDLGYSLLIKWLDDKKIVDINGVLTDDEQQDFLHMFDTRFWYYTKNGFRLGMDLGLYLNDSDQNYYEGFGTVDPSDDVATADYYDYLQYKVMPSITYQFKMVPLLLFASYSYSNLEYDNRLAKNIDGSAYLTENHDEEEEITTLGARYAFNDTWSVYCMYEHTDFSSNNLYESVYIYNYWIDAYTVGVSMKF